MLCGMKHLHAVESVIAREPYGSGPAGRKRCLGLASAVLWTLALSALIAACGGDGSGESSVGISGGLSADRSEPAADRPEAAADRPGGEIVLAVEQWPECLNPVTGCSVSTWLRWSVLDHLLPSLMEFDSENVLGPSPLLAVEPTVENGGAVVNGDGTFTVAYELNPDARWSDGEPITSSDVWFTWRAILDTEGSADTAGYDLIESIKHDDPHTAVVTYAKPYASWRYMFSRLLPQHAFDGETDISEHWNDAITVAGGPWKQESWSAEMHVLVPNENYWMEDRMPLVDRVVMIPREGSGVGMLALQTGEAMAGHMQPFRGFKDGISDGLEFSVGDGVFFEGLWLNQAAPERRFEITANLRRALAHSLDRQEIAETALGFAVESPEVLQCAGWLPTFGDWCGDDFSRYRQDMRKVAELLTAEGWTRPDPDGLWVNPDGVELVLQWNTVAGNQRRETVQKLVVEMTKPFGIGWEIVNYPAAELFQKRLPSMDFGPVALYAKGGSPDPSVVALYDIDGIPDESNGFSGQNHTAYASREASDLAKAIDGEVDEKARLELVKELNTLLAEDVPWIPLYVLPSLLVWNSDVLQGPGEWTSSVYGGFRDIYDWTVTG